MEFILIEELGSYFGVNGAEIYKIDRSEDGYFYKDNMVEVRKVDKLGGTTFLNTINDAFNTNFTFDEAGIFQDYN